VSSDQEVAHGEVVEAELVSFIERRALNADEAEGLWQAALERQTEERRAEVRVVQLGYHEREAARLLEEGG
jgi:hypothetical protein